MSISFVTDSRQWEDCLFAPLQEGVVDIERIADGLHALLIYIVQRVRS